VERKAMVKEQYMWQLYWGDVTINLNYKDAVKVKVKVTL
jgi:hypothetical protein